MSNFLHFRFQMIIHFHLNNVTRQMEYEHRGGVGVLDHIFPGNLEPHHITFGAPISIEGVNLFIRTLRWWINDGQMPSYCSEKSTLLYQVLIILDWLDIEGKVFDTTHTTILSTLEI